MHGPTYTEPFTVEDEGPHTVRYRAIDNEGNVSAPERISFEIKADACPGSDLRQTVIVRDVDSNVDNHDRGDSCTINDLIEDEREWANNGRFMAHVRAVTDRLVRDGVITRREQDDILRTAGQSSEGER